ncbi:MAG: tetratricopeptide repeat protein [Rhizobiales bacterium]|nr:tetratricopeptide repeat protein [Hyphomicrobiales bacterium]
MLGRTRLSAGLYQEAVEAFRRRLDLSKDDPTARAELAEAMVYAAGGQVTPGALEHFRAALETAPNEPRARYYLGLALAQEGEVDAAIEGWRQLLAASPSDAPWRPQILDAIRDVLASEGRPADEVIAGLPEGTAPTPADTATSSAEQDEMIRGMVEGLAARLENEPDDVQGWLMLGRSRLVLQEPELAKQAFERALALAPENPDVLIGYAASLLQPSATPGGDPVVGAAAAELYRKIIEIVPDNPEAHWYLGLAAVQAGTIDAAKSHWRRVLDVLGPDHPNYAAVQSSLEQVETKTQ